PEMSTHTYGRKIITGHRLHVRLLPASRQADICDEFVTGYSECVGENIVMIAKIFKYGSPSARDRITISVNPGVRWSCLTAYRTSFTKSLMRVIPAPLHLTYRAHLI